MVKLLMAAVGFFEPDLFLLLQHSNLTLLLGNPWSSVPAVSCDIMPGR